jgi:long-subunit acyl-CoA synthetase (AMP-forming)/alkylation response protein AidB-like acyl-CoA dehydrogenase
MPAATSTTPIPHAGPPATAVRGADSIAALLLERLDASATAAAICDPLDGARRWTWEEVVAAAVAVAEEFEAAGLRPGDRLAHVGPHTPDWIVVDLASQLAGLVHAPLHGDTSSADRAAELAWLRPRALVWSGGGGLPLAAGGAVPSIDLRSGGGRTGPWAAGVLRSAAWRTWLADRDRLRGVVVRLVSGCDPDACGSILLSSGTTGRPKGVLHSQRAVVANAAAAADVFLDAAHDVRLSWLPMSHAFARTGDLLTALVRGACLSVVTDRTQVVEACRVLPPTVVLGVPAFFQRLERAARDGRIPGLAAALGGQVRVCISGGAPLLDRTARAFADAGVPLVEGYGLAEAGPVVAVSNPRIARRGTVGPPLPGVEVRLDTRPECPGQLLVRTPSRALGVIEEGGGAVAPLAADAWIETGDLAAIDADGHLRITGRARDTLVLAGGTKVPPAEVEAALAEDPVVAQVCVVGSGLDFPVALVVPEPKELRTALARLGARVLSKRAALRHPRVLRWLARRLAARQRHLPRGWRVRRAVLVGRAFDAAHGEATPSLKLKRDRIAAHFARELSAAAEPVPPAWVAVVAAGRPPSGTGAHIQGRSAAPRAAAGLDPAAASLWQRGSAGADVGDFAAAAAAAAEPLGDAAAETIARSLAVLAALRESGQLYEPLAVAAPAAPLADAPPAPTGRFTAAAETAVGDAGLWGLLVPERFGGGGCGMRELAAAITRIGSEVPTAAGLLSVHSSIGAVAAITAFGSPEQQTRHLPGLARGRPLSIFGATEPQAGCDLAAITSRIERRDGRLLLSGTKMFITGATHGRLVKLLARLDERPVVALVRLPDTDTATCRLRHYGIHPLKHAHNAAIEFTEHPLDAADLLATPAGATDGMPIVWHGLNRGRVTLAAQAAGTLRLLAAHAREHAGRRHTWGEPIAARELIQGRLARIAVGALACDALAAWAAAAIDAGSSGELEAITAKIVAGECVRDAAIAALGVHGGRAFLVGHPLGDSFHDHFAVSVYEGESELLGLALFKGLAKRHPLASLAREAGAWRRGAAWLSWRAAEAAGRGRVNALLDRRLRDHATVARRQLGRLAVAIDRGLRRHGRGLAGRQLLVGAWSAEFRDLVSVLAVAHHADARCDDAEVTAADCWCRLALARSRGIRPTAADLAAQAAVGRAVVEGLVPLPPSLALGLITRGGEGPPPPREPAYADERSQDGEAKSASE